MVPAGFASGHDGRLAAHGPMSKRKTPKAWVAYKFAKMTRHRVRRDRERSVGERSEGVRQDRGR
jgi:hypothetical protein